MRQAMAVMRSLAEDIVTEDILVEGMGQAPEGPNLVAAGKALVSRQWS
jgi:hypothetical protein